ncbi:MAG TPA: DUF4167 domain-containing protein [Acidiphilium sp.]|jgi:hypothetical protein|uniref:DUF4167 domain-containing protein n=1 Tax=unclassified Acidiphilium TaxID=2617493 RepID=UPI000BD2D00A|nr:MULTISPECIES: DUF4167 domain-containing protein [unclassified Acidiphilium]OYV56198.1 MAG: hypothetical protein B7Z76_06935 [Acidiphilium sp. 20-67-58]OYV85137.1 MAG: hypothetical protein B7Z64_06205 [Acidiphilium sp. 21-68-69]HQT61367.1 DUF4167 domain-containing protein [Acidiphilium sp.]HQU11199.1 DUF4167 domain-containing protein [Acidiphilium sp.]
MNIKRMRGRNNRGGGGGSFRSYQGGTPLNRNHVFDSNGPEQRVRGTAQQLYDKYQQLGRDASSAGDRVLAESYFQYAEHYFRIISAMNQAAQTQHGNGHARRNDASQSSDAQDDQDLAEPAPGLGDQPSTEAREIPISAAPPEV